MNSSPFFSILLPTKNRSHLVCYAIRSVLQQDFTDFELIICDNDDAPDATRRVVEQYPDPRIKYIRTGGLDMIANWNTALDAATGQHVTVLEDKMIFYRDALTHLSKKINESTSGVVVWRTDEIDDTREPCRLHKSIEQPDRVLISSDTINRFLNVGMAALGLLPRGLCSSVPIKLIKSIEEKDQERFYERISPDIVSAFKVLVSAETYLFTGKPLTLTTSIKVSNGKQMSERRTKDLSYFMGKSDAKLDLKYVPVNNPYIVSNTVLDDCAKILVRDNFCKSVEYCLRNYIKIMAREFVVKSLASNGIIWSSKEVGEVCGFNGEYLRNFAKFTGYSILFLLRINYQRLRKRQVILENQNKYIESILAF